jgi:ABC-2 type transport system permease protein
MRELRAYRAAFSARFLLTLQYRVAAVSGFVTQCWWGGIKVMVYGAFFAAGGGSARLDVAQAISYTWIAQGLLALLPWAGDPEVGDAVRSGSIAIERLRPIDTYGWWFARSAAWMLARALPRALLMALFAAGLLPLCGLGHYRLRPPASWSAGLGFVLSVCLLVLLASAVTQLVNVLTVVQKSHRGASSLVGPVVVLLSGNEIPLLLFPDWAQSFLLLQPFAGLMDIPLRIYLGLLSGRGVLLGLGLQLFWSVSLGMLGRWQCGRAFERLEVQGG